MPIAKRPSVLMDRVTPRLAPKSLQALEHWEVTKHLGSGSSAEVWLLEDKAHRRQVACKTPRSGGVAIELSQEAELAGQLSHENIVKAIDISDDQELSSLKVTSFWEFLPGGTLTGLIGSGGQLSVPQTVTIVLPLIQATQYLLARQIVHGDISPRNIMFDLTGRPVLIDFGATRATAHHYERTGTPGFIAPELLLPSFSDTDLDAGADIYALAAVAWFCLTGTVPGSPQHRVPLITLRPDLEPEIIDVLESGLNAEPTSRPDLDDMLASIAQWAIPEPIDLYASVGEEYELLLPTRQPKNDIQRKRSFRRSKSSTVKPVGSRRRRSTSNAAQRRRSYRFGIAFGAILLAGGAAITMTYESDSVQYSSTAREDATESTVDEDFQAVVDTLAKARSGAWEDTDPGQIEQYALIDSQVFYDDEQLLRVLDEAEHYLEGIRMRAVVERVKQTGDIAVLLVRWRIDGYVQRDAAGNSLQKMEPRDETIELELVETANGWRMATVR